MRAVGGWKKILLFGLVTSLFSLLSACRDCSTQIQKTVDLVPNSKDSSSMSLPLESLSFLSDSTIVWDSIELSVTLKGQRNIKESMEFSLNGLKMTRRNGSRLMDALDFNKKKNQSLSQFHLHKMNMNGAEPFHVFLARIYKNKGKLDLVIRSKNKVEVVSAQITFNGRSYTQCGPTAPTPTPTPTPAPVAPQTSIDSTNPAKTSTSSTNMLISFSSDIAGSSFWCSLDGAAEVNCTSPQSYSDLSNGAHKFKVSALSPQGMKDQTPATFNWTVDAVAPTVQVTNSAQLSTLTKSGDISFQFTANKAGSTFKCSLDGSTSSVCSSPKAYSGLTEGVHVFSVNATDTLGNTGKVPDSFQWTIDQTPPVVSFLDVQPVETLSNSTNKSFTFAADESATYECSLDSANFAPCSSPLVLSNVAEGDHVMEVRGTDAAGNQGLVSSYNWSVDITSPVLSLGAVSPAQGATNAKHISAEINASEAVSLYCSLDGAAAQACQSPYSADIAVEGDHTLVAYGVDAAGNQSAAVQLQWDMDFVAPVVSFGAILPSAASVVNVNALSIEVNAPQGTSLSASLNGNSLGAVQSPISLSDLVEGDYSLSVSGTDAAGNVSNPVVHEFRVDMTAPVISMQAEITASPTNSDRNSFALSASEDVKFECNLDNAGFASCDPVKEVSGLADGSHGMVVRGTDEAGNVSAVVSYSWVVDATPPTTQVSGSVVEDSASLVLSSNESNVTYLCSLDGSAFSVCGVNVSYSSLAVGAHSFVAKAVDQAQNVDSVGATYQFIVTKPIKTTLTSKDPTDTITSSRVITFAFAADQANATFKCSLDGAAAVTCTSPSTYSGLNDGNHSFIVKAVDAYGNMDATGASYSWAIDGTGPIYSGITFSMTTNSITITWSTNEPSTGQVFFGVGSALNQSTAIITDYSVSHSVRITGLSSNTTYSIQIVGKDALGNATSSAVKTAKTSR